MLMLFFRALWDLCDTSFDFISYWKSLADSLGYEFAKKRKGCQCINIIGIISFDADTGRKKIMGCVCLQEAYDSQSTDVSS